MFAFLSLLCDIWCLCSNKWNWTVAQNLSDHYKQFTFATYHNALFIHAIVGNITAVTIVTLEQGLWKSPNMNIITTVSYHYITVFLTCVVMWQHWTTWLISVHRNMPRRLLPFTQEHKGFQKERQDRTSYSKEYKATTCSFVCLITHWRMQTASASPLHISPSFSLFYYITLIYFNSKY